MNGKLVAQSICDWMVRYAKTLEKEEEPAAGEFFGFASILQTMIDDGVYGQ